MSKKNKQSPVNEVAAVEEKEVIATESLNENEIVIAEEAVVETTIEAPVEEAKKEKEARKNQHVVDIKEVRLGLNTDVGDFTTKVNQAIRFLQHGDKVKVNIRFRGREMGHPEMGLESMRRFAEACAEHASVEKPAKLEGRNMLMFLAPKAAK